MFEIFLPFLRTSEKAQIYSLKSFFRKDKDLFILHIQDHGSWCPGDAKTLLTKFTNIIWGPSQ